MFFGDTALMRASRDGNLSRVDSLIQGGASLDIQDSIGNTALMLEINP